MVRLTVEDLEGRSLMSAVAPVPPPAGQATVGFTAPIGSNKGSFAGDGWSIDDKWMTTPAHRPAHPTGIIAILIGL